ncbi:MAG: DUF4397 domain-containing protein [Geminicoccaceae bacterium]
MRMMQSSHTGIFALCLAPFLGAASVNAADTFVVHGIPGQDLGLAPELTVDIAANGGCLLPGVEFGDVAGPVDVAPGAYDIEIRLANAGNPCSGAIAVTGSADIGVAPASVVIAHLDQNGGPEVSKFTTKTSAVDPANARITVYHTAAAPDVDLRLNLASDHRRVAAIQGLGNGEQTFPADLPADSYAVLVSPASGQPGRFLDPIAEIPVSLDGGTATAVFAVGSLDNQTFSVIPVAVIE